MTRRQEKLLREIIKKFVNTAQPVSSKLLENSRLFDLSSATIRNEMSELEREGYLVQLHTSGGRMPTDKAYRYFVDNIVNQENLEPDETSRRRIEKAVYDGGLDPRDTNKSVAQTLSDLSDNLVISSIDDDFYKVGLSSLFEMPEFQALDKVFRMTNFFDQFESMFDRLEREILGQFENADNEIRVFIGQENPISDARDETVIFSRYNLPGNCTGSMTLIGPTRMNYKKNIGLLKYATERLNELADFG